MCYKCKEKLKYQGSHGENDPDYSTGKDKAALMDFCVKQEWWPHFIHFVANRAVGEGFYGASMYRYLWRNLPELIVEYEVKEKNRKAL